MAAKPKCLTLDANILLRAVFGVRVRHLIDSHEESATLCTPAICIEEARGNIPLIATRRRTDAVGKLLLLDDLLQIVEVVESSSYDMHGLAARDRISSRDIDDWPIVATALLLNSPIWTEDLDIFGCGVATWTTATVEVYLRDA